MKTFKFYLFLSLFYVLFLASTSLAKECNYWQGIVGADVSQYKGEQIDIKSPEKITEGIECLLLLQGHKSIGAFGGATHFQVSQLLPMASVEICALYKISWMFTGKYDHASGVVLIDKKSKFNTKKSVKIAYKKYRKWWKKVKELGLEEARKQKLDPLKGARVSWY